MDKKILCIFVCALLVVFPSVSSLGPTSQKKSCVLEVKTKKYASSHQDTTGRSISMTNWLEIAKLLSMDGAKSDQFGWSVSIDGEYAVVGANGDDSFRGAAYVFKRSGTSWTQEAKLYASDREPDDNFGVSVSISGDYAVIGACGDDSYQGSAYIFKRSGTSWIQEVKLYALDHDVGDYFGFSVSISGDYSVIGASYDDSFRGAAYVFKRSGTSWTQEAKLYASDREPDDNFGVSVSIDGDYTVIGAYGDDSFQGSAYIFKRLGSSWTQEAKLTAPDAAILDNFGFSVSIDDEYALIGAYGDDSSQGSAYVFKRLGTSWTQEAKLTASDGIINDYFGRSVSIDDEYIVIGAFGDDDLGISSGSAYIFKRLGTSWIQEKKLTASDGASGDVFGWSVSISGYYILIGAHLDDNIHGTDVGSAYVFQAQLPKLVIDAVKGGFCVSVVIKNTGTIPATDISGTINLTAGFILFGKTTTRTESVIPVDGSITIKSKWIIGFGKTPFVITVTCSEGVTAEKTLNGFVLFFFVLLI